MIPIPKSVRFAHALVKRGVAQWYGGKPVVKPLRPRKGFAMIADAVLENRGLLTHRFKLMRLAQRELKRHRRVKYSGRDPR